MLRYKTKTKPGLVALYDIRPGNGAGPFLQPRSPHGAAGGGDGGGGGGGGGGSICSLRGGLCCLPASSELSLNIACHIVSETAF